MSWGAWAGAGMAANAGLHRMERLGFGAIVPAQGVACLRALVSQTGAALPAHLVASVFFWDRIKSSDPIFAEVKGIRESAVPPAFAKPAGGQTLPASQSHGAGLALSLEAVEAAVAQAVASVLGSAVPRDDPLVAAGVDSLGEADQNALSRESFVLFCFVLSFLIFVVWLCRCC